MAATSANSRPNVLFILCDDLRPAALDGRTPHIERLAREGTRFANAFCTTSLCSPSRATILSGVYAHRHGVLNNFTEYPVDLPSFPRQLQKAGYETAYLGKWHMGEENDEKRPGFDYFVTHKGQGKYYDTEFNVDGERKVVPGYYTQAVTDMAIDWLKRPRAAEKPFLLMVGHKAPHSFYTPEEKYRHTFDGVRDGRAECAQTALTYFWGKEPALVFATGAPFGGRLRGATTHPKSGRSYMVSYENTGSLIYRFDPATGQMTEYRTPSGGGGPHTLVITDDQGQLRTRCMGTLEL